MQYFRDRSLTVTYRAKSSFAPLPHPLLPTIFNGMKTIVGYA